MHSVFLFHIFAWPIWHAFFQPLHIDISLFLFLSQLAKMVFQYILVGIGVYNKINNASIVLYLQQSSINNFSRLEVIIQNFTIRHKYYESIYYDSTTIFL